MDSNSRRLHGGRLGDGKLRTTFKLMGDHLKVHVNTQLQHQVLLPLVRSAVPTDVEKVVCKVEAAVSAMREAPSTQPLSQAEEVHSFL